MFSSTFYKYEISFATKGHPKISTVTTTKYGKRAFISMAAKTWNIQCQIKDPMISTFSPNKPKLFLLEIYLNLLLLSIKKVSYSFSKK